MAKKVVKSESTTDLQDTNFNVTWMGGKGSWLLFVFLLYAARYVLLLMGMGDGSAWGLIHLAHVSITFFLFHWFKGTPLDYLWSTNSSQGQFDKLTWWEQLDSGAHWTDNKKFLFGLVVFTYIMAVRPVSLRDNPMLALSYTCIFGFGAVPKLPALHRVRLFGVNED